MKELVKHFSDVTFHDEIEKGITLVDFYAVWCGPCKMLSPLLDKVAEFYKGKVTVAKMDVDSAQNIAMEYKISSVPTVILFRNGKEVNRIVGLRDIDGLKSFIETAF